MNDPAGAGGALFAHLFLLFVILLLVKRAVLGPLPLFARTVLTLTGVALLFAFSSDGRDLQMEMSGWFLLAAASVCNLMFMLEVAWMLRHRKFPWR